MVLHRIYSLRYKIVTEFTLLFSVSTVMSLSLFYWGMPARFFQQRMTNVGKSARTGTHR